MRSYLFTAGHSLLVTGQVSTSQQPSATIHRLLRPESHEAWGNCTFMVNDVLTITHNEYICVHDTRYSGLNSPYTSTGHTNTPNTYKSEPTGWVAKLFEFLQSWSGLNSLPSALVESPEDDSFRGR